MQTFSFRLFIAAACVAAAHAGSVPREDRRNTETPDTKTHFTMPEYKTLAEWKARKARLRKQILSAAGLLPLPEKTPLHPRIFGRIEHHDYAIEKVLLETLPGYYLGGNLYRPLRRSGKLPAIATPHGHWTYGRLENQQLASIPERAINFALQGYVVFAYDMVGYNDTIQTPHDFGDTPVERLWSFGPLGLQLWNSIRVVDFLQSLPEVDPSRIAMTGASGGGTQTFLLAAVDDRVKWSAPVNMISAIMQGGSKCENAPGLRVGAFNVEFGAMMAPRPMIMVSTTQDWTRNTPREEFPAIRHIYELYGRPENVETVQIDAPHNYNQASREAVYRFFGKHILGDSDPRHFAEKNVPIEKLADMLALHNRKLPANALTREGLFEEWKRIARRQTDVLDAGALRERLTYALGAEWPAEVNSEMHGEHIALGREGRGDRVPGIWIPGTGRGLALVVDPEGAQHARQTAQARSLLAAGNSVLLIDAFQTGAAVVPRNRSAEFFLTFNQSDDANRVQDILTALRFLNARASQPITLAATGKAAIWALFAAAVAPVNVSLDADPAGFTGSDEDFARDFFVPGIQRAGGLSVARRLAAAPGNASRHE
jgi:dienelactone hydrolase